MNITGFNPQQQEQGKISYSMNVSGADSFYTILYGTTSMKGKSDKNGVLKFEVKSGKERIPLKVIRQNL